MADNLIMLGLGLSIGLAMVLTIMLVVARNWRLLPALSSQLLIVAYLYVMSTGMAPWHQALLFTGLLLGLASVLTYWPKMLRQAHDYLWPWSLILLSLIVVLCNQLLWSSLVVFLLPVWLCSMAIVLQQAITLNALQSAYSTTQQQLSKSEIAVGLDMSSGLPNKLAFTSKIDKRLMFNPSKKVDVVVLKLTQFELLNTLIGHQNADVVKMQMATRMRNVLSGSSDIMLLSEHQQTAFLATLGGVDFCFAAQVSAQSYATEKLLKEIAETINEPLLINATAIDIGVQFGVAQFPEHGASAQDLLEHAYLALSHQNRPNNSVYFDASLEHKLHVNRTVVSQLREDLNHNKFELFVQPQIDLLSNAVEGGEVLIRWRRDDAGILTADKFIDLAEESGVIYQLSIWCLELTVQKLAELKSLGLPQYLAVNISNKELFQSQLVETVSSLIAKYDIEPEKLVLEIKESAFAIDRERALKTVRLLSQLGVRVGIDEFGKDQSALSSFNRFLPWYVKVDCKSLNTTKGGDNTNTYINAIIGLARNLNIKTIAHGIEMESTINQLIDIECDGAQGYFYSKPFELTGFEIWLEQWDKKSV